MFAARIMVEPASNPQYKDANKLANVVAPGEPQYAAIMRGESVQPDPINARPRKAKSTGSQKPAWRGASSFAPADRALGRGGPGCGTCPDRRSRSERVAPGQGAIRDRR